MEFSSELLHQINDQLTTPDCAVAHLCRHIAAINVALNGGFDPATQQTFLACLSLVETRLRELLIEEGWQLSPLQPPRKRAAE